MIGAFSQHRGIHRRNGNGPGRDPCGAPSPNESNKRWQTKKRNSPRLIRRGRLVRHCYVQIFSAVALMNGFTYYAWLTRASTHRTEHKTCRIRNNTVHKCSSMRHVTLRIRHRTLNFLQLESCSYRDSQAFMGQD
jgi:hypothetical protein